MSNYSSYLIHYGVPGQKWGVRRYQNEDGTYTDLGKRLRRSGDSEALVLPKGSTVYRVSKFKKDKLTKGSKYLYTDADKDVYEGAFSTFLKNNWKRSKDVYRKTYETKEDLIAPTEKKLNEIVSKRLEKDMGLNMRTYFTAVDMLQSGHPLMRNVGAHIANPKYEKDPAFKEDVNRKIMIRAYNSMIENDKRELNNLLKEVSKQGYNAIMDQNNVRIYNNAAEPFITMNAKKTLKQINNEKLEDEYIHATLKKLEKKIGSRAFL